jgi:hypothetical protein
MKKKYRMRFVCQAVDDPEFRDVYLEELPEEKKEPPKPKILSEAYRNYCPEGQITHNFDYITLAQIANRMMKDIIIEKGLYTPKTVMEVIDERIR